MQYLKVIPQMENEIPVLCSLRSKTGTSSQRDKKHWLKHSLGMRWMRKLNENPLPWYYHLNKGCSYVVCLSLYFILIFPLFECPELPGWRSFSEIRPHMSQQWALPQSRKPYTGQQEDGQQTRESCYSSLLSSSEAASEILGPYLRSMVQKECGKTREGPVNDYSWGLEHRTYW